MKNILLVEDTKEIYQMVLQSVSDIGEVTWAKCINEAATLINKKEFNLLILDVELPDGNGIEFCSSIQSTHPHVPIFFLTSHTNLNEKSEAFTAGADSYITKPFTPPELRARILAIDDASANLTLLGKFLGK
ncbi:MAG TPA: response regulator transcription factor [Bacteriovoracaceae bacterium]|nr:response regulator transcription factor [Bacteriovoracaceae bacterium]